MAISQALSFKILSEIVLLAKTLLLEYATSSAKQASSNLFLKYALKHLFSNFSKSTIGKSWLS